MLGLLYVGEKTIYSAPVVSTGARTITVQPSFAIDKFARHPAVIEGNR